MSDDTGPGAVSWFDITVEDAAGLTAFYEAVAGWRREPVEMGGYENYNMYAPGTDQMVAAICHPRDELVGMPPEWIVYITVEGLDERIATARGLGGKLLLAPSDTCEGRYAVIEDPAGAPFALWEGNLPPRPRGIAGSIGHADLTVEDAVAVCGFYGKVVGWRPMGLDMGGYEDFGVMPEGSDEWVAGICHRRGSNADLPPRWLVYISVPELDESVATAISLGGRLIGEVRGGMEGGRYAVLEDRTGAAFALMELAG